MRFQFDTDKAVEGVLYVADRVGSDMYKTLKTFYIADKLHLERYGSLIFGDQYFALPYGPVPTGVYDMIKHVRGDNPLACQVPNAGEAFAVEKNHIKAKRQPDLSVFSESDVECLKEAINRCSNLSFPALKELTHDDAYNSAARNSRIALEAIAATLPNSAELIQHLADPHPGDQ